MKINDEIEELFSTSFDGAEMTPPTDVLENIKKEIFPVGNANTRKGGWLFMILSITAAAGLVSMMFSKSQSANRLNSSHLNIKSESSIEGNSKNRTENSSVQNDDSYFEKTQVEEPDTSIEDIKKGKVDASASDESKINSSSSSFQVTSTNATTALVNPSNNKTIEKNQEKQASLIQNDQLTSFEKEVFSDGEKEDYQKQSTVLSSANEPLKSFGKVNSENEINDNSLNTNDALDLLPVSKLTGLSNSSEPNIIGKELINGSHNKPNRLSLSLYSGLTFGTNIIKEGNNTSSLLKMNERIGFSASMELNYMLNHPFSLSAGIDFSTRKDVIVESVATVESIQTSEWQYTYDSTIMQLDSTLVNINTDVASVNREESTIQFYSIGIPIYFNYDRFFHKRFQFSLGMGVKLSYLNYKTIDENPSITYPDYSHFGMNAMLRPEVRYVFSRFSIGVYAKVEYDILTGMKWQDLSRQRYGWNAGITLRYKL